MNNEKTAPRSNIRRETVKFYCTERGWRITAVAKAVSVMDSSGEKLTLERQNGFDVRTLAEHELKAILTVFDYNDLNPGLFELILSTVEKRQEQQNMAMERLAKIGVPVQSETQEPEPGAEELSARRGSECATN